MFATSQIRFVLNVLAVFALGMLAGLMFGTGMEDYTFRSMPQGSWIEEHQAEDSLFRRVMPPVFLTTAVLAVAATLIAAPRARWWLAAAAGLAIFCMIFTIRAEVPLNRLIATWTPEAAPPEWSAIRAKWLANHLVRVIAGAVAFLSATVALARQ